MRAHTSALHLHGRRTYAGLLCRLPSHLMLSCSPLDGRVAPRRAAAARRRPVAAAPLSPPREAPLLLPLPPLPRNYSALRLPWPLPPTRNLWESNGRLRWPPHPPLPVQVSAAVW